MSASTRRRPLPALAFLLILSVVTAVVWWRVLHRPTTDASVPVPRVSCAPGKKPVPLPKAKQVIVRVLNGTNRDGLAGSVTTQLHGRGFTTQPAGDLGSALSGVAEIRYGVRAKTGATLLSFSVPGAKLVQQNRRDLRIDLVLGGKFTALGDTAQAARLAAQAARGC